MMRVRFEVVMQTIVDRPSGYSSGKNLGLIWNPARVAFRVIEQVGRR